MRVLRLARFFPCSAASAPAAPQPTGSSGSMKRNWTIVAMKAKGKAAPDDLLKGLTVTFERILPTLVDRGAGDMRRQHPEDPLDDRLLDHEGPRRRQAPARPSSEINAETPHPRRLRRPGSPTRPTTLESRADTTVMVHVLERVVTVSS